MSIEHYSTATHPQYLPAVNQTMLTVYLDGEVRVEHGEPVVVTTKESR